MEIIGAFLILCGVTLAKDGTESYNSKQTTRELVQMERESRKAFDKMIQTSERLSREGN